MTKKIIDQSYNTNLASEYFTMSIMHRAGKEAYLSLGNKKGVDIIVKTNKGNICLIEVKGVNKRNDWLIGNSGKLNVSPNLFYMLICYNGRIEEIEVTPDFWLVPSVFLSKTEHHKIASNRKTVFISNKLVRESFEQFKNKLYFFEEYLVKN